MKRLSIGKSILACLLSLALTFSAAACGNPGSVPAATPDADAAPAQDGAPSGSEATEAPEADTDPLAAPDSAASKESHADFYMEVNKAWFDENPLEPGLPFFSYNMEAADLVSSRFDEMFETASPEDFAEDDPVRKMVEFYRQLTAEGLKKPASTARLKELADAIESQKNLQQFYDNVLKDEKLSLFNNLMYQEYSFSSDERYRIYYHPIPLGGFSAVKSEEEVQAMLKGYGRMLTDLGYPSEKAMTMAQNALTVDLLASEFLCSCDPSVLSYNEQSEDLLASSFPLLAIMEALGYSQGYAIRPGDKDTHYQFFASPSYLPFMEELFVPENLQMLKDYYVVCMLERLCCFGSEDLAISYAKILLDILEIPEEDLALSGSQSFDVGAILSLDTGALNKWYADRYVTEAQKAETLAMADEVSEQMQQIISEIDWASARTRQAWTVKLKKIRYCLGCYEEYDHLPGFELGETSVDSALSLLECRREYNKQFLQGSGIKQDTFTCDLSSVNAYYLSDGGNVAICNGLLAQVESLGPDASYEEKLAFLGRVIAHELSHCIDINNIHLDCHGKADSWTEDPSHIDNFQRVTGYVYDFYDGKTTEYGNPIDAGMIYNESYCDLLSMDCCLRMLSQRDNADYDTFFRMYARQNACVMTPNYEAYILKTDTHLQSHERVNYTLAQFDEFYATYDIDENSPYFVPKKDRIRLF